MSEYGTRFYVRPGAHERDVDPEWRIMHATETFAVASATVSEMLDDGTWEVRTWGPQSSGMVRRMIASEGMDIVREVENTNPLDALLRAE